MRIVYGVHGYGRGHAMRAAAMLPELEKRHDVLVLAGTEAYDVLEARHNVVRIPKFGFHYKRPTRISASRTLRFNLSAYLDLALRGPTVQMVEEVLHDFGTDVVISDSEAFVLKAASKRGIPRIICDHFGLLVFCRPETVGRDHLVRWGQALVYRALYGNPDRAVVCGFFDAPPHRPGVTVVGPIIRDEVRRHQPSRGDFLLVYISKGDQEYTEQIDRAIVELDYPVKVYGAPRRGTDGKVEFKPLANTPFIEDLAACRAVFGTTGNQLIGEVMHFGKPMLGMPIDCLEQRLNAQYVERLGIGMGIKRRDVSAGKLREFLDRCDDFGINTQKFTRDGKTEALRGLEVYLNELASPVVEHEREIPRWQAER